METVNKNQNDLLNVLLYFVSIAGWIVSCILTVNLLVEFFNISPFWKFIGIIIGIIFDSSKIASLIWYLKSRYVPSLLLTVTLVSLSVLASLGALTSYNEKTSLLSPEYQNKQESLKILDNQIQELNNQAQSHRKVKQITKAGMTLNNVNGLIDRREKLNSELKQIQFTSSGINGAIFRSFANIFQVDIFSVSFAGNLIISLLLEIVSIFAFVFIFNKNKHSSYSNNGIDDGIEISENSVKVDKENQGKSDKQILKLFDSGIRNQSKIARILKISRQYVNQVLKRNHRIKCRTKEKEN